MEYQWQVLEWEATDTQNTSMYEVVVEELKMDDKTKSHRFTECARYKVSGDATSVKMSPLLPVGDYRYKVISYNLLGLPASQSEWEVFSIVTALEPVIRNVSIASVGGDVLYLDEVYDCVLILTGRNLFPEEGEGGGKDATHYELVKDGGTNVAIKVLEADGQKARIKVDMTHIDVGTYHIAATDASGLKNKDDAALTVKFGKPVDFSIAAGWVCPIFVIDDTFPTYVGSKAYPISAMLRGTFIPLKRGWGYIGASLCAMYTRMSYDGDGFTLDGNMITAIAALVYQKPFFHRRAAFEARLGGGLVALKNYMYHFDGGYDTPALNGTYPAASASLSVQYTIIRKLYAELGADFTMSFMPDIKPGFITPQVCVGWRF